MARNDEPDPEALRDAIVALLAVLEHDPATVETVTITPGEVQVFCPDPADPDELLVWDYRWPMPLVD